jgi:hypothetical protein
MLRRLQNTVLRISSFEIDRPSWGWTIPLRAEAITSSRQKAKMGSLVRTSCERQNGLVEPELVKLRVCDELVRVSIIKSTYNISFTYFHQELGVGRLGVGRGRLSFPRTLIISFTRLLLTGSFFHLPSYGKPSFFFSLARTIPTPNFNHKWP